MTAPGLDELGPAGQAVWRVSWDCPPVPAADLADEAAAIERRRTEPHLCALHGEHLANAALIARPRDPVMLLVSPPVWVDVCWAAYNALRLEGGPGLPAGRVAALIELPAAVAPVIDGDFDAPAGQGLYLLVRGRLRPVVFAVAVPLPGDTPFLRWPRGTHPSIIPQTVMRRQAHSGSLPARAAERVSDRPGGGVTAEPVCPLHRRHTHPVRQGERHPSGEMLPGGDGPHPVVEVGAVGESGDGGVGVVLPV